VEMMFNKFTIGEWVVLVDHMLNGFGGYVEEFDLWTGTYLIQLTTNLQGEQTAGHLWVSEISLLADEIALDEHDIQNLVDCSLATKDEQWFHELSQQLQMVV
jgi:hypothetical protein